MPNYEIYAKYAFQSTAEDVARAKEARAKPGSYLYTLSKAETNCRWPNFAECKLWIKDIEEKMGFRFVIKQTTENGVHYQRNIEMVCSRSKTGGDRHYKKRERPRESNHSRKARALLAHIIRYKSIWIIKIDWRKLPLSSIRQAVSRNWFCHGRVQFGPFAFTGQWESHQLSSIKGYETGDDSSLWERVYKTTCCEYIHDPCWYSYSYYPNTQMRLVTSGYFNANAPGRSVRLREEVISHRDVRYAQVSIRSICSIMIN